MSRSAGEAYRDERSRREALVVSLAQSFSDAHRNGERPTIDEYVARHPELEAEIRELFPMLRVLEKLGPRSADPGVRGPPQKLGEYRIIREIGRGGMGVVYEAEQESLKRRVALKVLSSQPFNDEHQLERFRREAQAAAQLHHTSIVPVFGVGEDGGVPYYVMQFIRGQTLTQVLKEVRRLRVVEGATVSEPLGGEEVSAAGLARTLIEIQGGTTPVPVPGATGLAGDSTSGLDGSERRAYFLSAARIALQVAEALSYAHNEGILHRDIKPSNLLLDLKGTVWITDFGLAKVQGSGELTVSGSLVGTMRYMAPERFRGAGDSRSDVYSLGVTLYEVLTLRPAFAASDRAELMREVTGREPVPPRRLDPAIPRDLETIVLKAIAKEPQHRYAGAASLADDLRRFLHHEPVSARRASPPERLWRWAQRNPALAASTALIALLLVALAAGGVLSAASQRAAFDQARSQLVTAKLEEGRAWRLSRELGGRARSLSALREAVTPETANRVRNEIIGALAMVDLEEVYRRDWGGDRAYYDELMARIALPLPDGAIEVYQGFEDRRLVAMLEGSGKEVDQLSLSPGGEYLAAGQGDGGLHDLTLWQVDPPQRVFEKTCQPTLSAFDSRVERFAYVAVDGTILIVSLPSGTEVQRIEGSWPAQSLYFDPGGRRLTAVGVGFNASSVVAFDLDTGNESARLHHPNTAYVAAWHPNGRWLAVGCRDFKVHLWEVDSGTRLRSLAGHDAEVSRVAFSHAGRYLASTGWDNRTSLWEAGTGDLLIKGVGGFSAFSKDDRFLAFDRGKRSANLWRLSGGECYQTLDAPMPGKGPLKLDISADGRWLAAACGLEGIRLWSLAAPEEPYRLESGKTLAVCFERDGAALWAASEEGLFRWPVSRSECGTEWSFGPPERIASQRTEYVAVSADGRRVATIMRDQGHPYLMVHDLDETWQSRNLGLHPGANRCVLCPSGRWVLSSTFHGKDVRVWDLSDGSLAQTFEVGTATACFSPDGRWLALSWGSSIAAYEAGSWKLGFKVLKEADHLGSPLRFTADGRFLAAGLSRSLVALLRVEDGGEVARFEAPGTGISINDLVLDEGQRFLAASSTTNKVLLWDLHALRHELRAMDLDWSTGGLPPKPGAAPPPRVRVDPGSMKAGVPSSTERAIRKNWILDTLSRRVELDPSPEVFNARAAAFEEVGDWGSALADLNRVIEAYPQDISALARRARVHQRMWHLEQAIRDQDRVIDLCRGPAKDLPAVQPECSTALLTATRFRAHRGAAAGLAGIPNAWADWKEVLAQAPGDLEASGELAWLWIIRRCADSTADTIPPLDDDAGLALACAKANHGVDPENLVFARNLGAILVHFGRFAEAQPLLEKVLRLSPRSVSTVLHLAVIKHHQGDGSQARRQLEKAAGDIRKRYSAGSADRQFMEAILSFAECALATQAKRP